MTEQLVCADCGAPFSVPDRVRERFPGWTPSRCRRCHAAARGSGGGQGGGGSGGQGNAGSGGQRGSGQRGSGQRRGGRPGGGGAAAREENLTVSEVLERYTEGPVDGVFTDGSADPNPGPGGWGAVYVIDDTVVDERWGHDPDTTNNRMELTALLEGIDLVPEGTPATVYSDSRLVVDTVTKWAAGWARNGWRRKTGPVQNLDLVKAVHERASARPEIEVAWIKAHAGSRWNEYADALATAYRRAHR